MWRQHFRLLFFCISLITKGLQRAIDGLLFQLKRLCFYEELLLSEWLEEDFYQTPETCYRCLPSDANTI